MQLSDRHRTVIWQAFFLGSNPLAILMVDLSI